MPIDWVREGYRFLTDRNHISSFDAVQVLHEAYKWLRRDRGTGTASPPTERQAGEAPKDIAANRAMKDEAHELHALLKAMSDEAKKTGIYYRLKPSEFWIPHAIWSRLPSGAVKKLFDIFATGVVPKRHTEHVGETKQPPGEDGKPRKPIPIKEEWVVEENVMGPELIRGLVWMAVQAQASTEIAAVPPGTDAKLKGVLYVVEMLKSSYRLKNTEDDLAEAAKKGKTLAALAATNVETLAHLAKAWQKLGWNWESLQEVLAYPSVEASRNAIDQATDEKKLEAHETFKRELLRGVVVYNTRPGRLERIGTAARSKTQGNLMAAGLTLASFTTLIIALRWLFAA